MGLILGAVQRTPYMTTSKNKSVMVSCPRCSGRGSCTGWTPDNGVCYLCKGEGSLAVDPERGERHLAVLRKQWCAARDAGDQEAMEYLALKGKRKALLVAEARKLAR